MKISLEGSREIKNKIKKNANPSSGRPDFFYRSDLGALLWGKVNHHGELSLRKQKKKKGVGGFGTSRELIKSNAVLKLFRQSGGT